MLHSSNPERCAEVEEKAPENLKFIHDIMNNIPPTSLLVQQSVLL